MTDRRQFLAGLGASGLTMMVAPMARAETFYKMATLAPGSSPYMIMSTFAQIVGEDVEGASIQVNATGAATAHAVQAAQGNLDFFMMAPIVHQFMTEGSEMFASIPQAPDLSKSLRAVLAFPIGFYHIVTWADSGIESFEDFRGKKVLLGPPAGSATATMERMIEGAAGLKRDVDYTAVVMGTDAALQAFQDGRIDVFSNATLPPSPLVEQLALSRDIRLIGLTPEQLERPGIAGLINRPGGALRIIPAGIYGDHQVNEEDVHAVASYGGIGTNKDLRDDVIYAMTKAFWERIEPMREGAPWLRNVTLDTAFEDLNMLLHPGAIRYYEEIGMTIPDALRMPA